MPSAPSYIANFDSATAMFRATSRFLQGKDFPALGLSPAMKPVAKSVNAVPERARETIYGLSGGDEAASLSQLNKVDAEALASWIVGEYPERRYPLPGWFTEGQLDAFLEEQGDRYEVEWAEETASDYAVRRA